VGILQAGNQSNKRSGKQANKQSDGASVARRVRGKCRVRRVRGKHRARGVRDLLGTLQFWRAEFAARAECAPSAEFGIVISAECADDERRVRG
jgi:hypothetical protein